MDVRRLALALMAALLLSVAQAQPGLAPGDPALPPGAHTAWTAALETAEFASTTPLPWTPDAEAWTTALRAARAAVAAAPDHPAPQRLLTRVYATVGWWVRVLSASEALRRLRPDDPWTDPEPAVPAGPPTRALVAGAYRQLGFARYQADDLQGAVDVFGRWVATFPDDPDGRRWLARALLDLRDPTSALPHLERWLELQPDDPDATFFLAEARLAANVGSEASFAFRDGANRYAAGDLEGAAAAFEVARRAAPSFADAHAWAGRVALERGDPASAVVAFASAVELRPDDDGLGYFLRLAETQVAYGVEAGRAFFAGLSAYEVGDAATATQRFEEAVAANDGFAEAWAWLGRTRQELGRLAAAERAWARVVELDPADRRAGDFLNLLRQQLAYGAGDDDPAANAFAAGVAAFERADFAFARERFEAVVAADPDAGLAWAWLGRLAYTQRDFEEAALAYERAARLLPDDEDVAWFAEDSAWRAGWTDDDPTVDEPVDEPAADPTAAEPVADEPADDADDGPPVDEPDADPDAGGGP